jgi:RNA polymerase sigma-70 factor (ECF subfamily)
MMQSLSLDNAPPITKQALVGIYEQHSPGLYRYAYRLLGDRHLAEECVSETFSRFLQSVRNGRWPDQNVQGYLYRMAHNWATDQYRKRTLETVELDAELHSDPHGNPAHQLAEGVERERVRKALMALPEDQRKVVVLRLMEQWSHEDVANALGKTVEATRALQHRALTALRRILLADDLEA